jgi:Ca2+-binding EF-hand superfamily protein
MRKRIRGLGLAAEAAQRPVVTMVVSMAVLMGASAAGAAAGAVTRAIARSDVNGDGMLQRHEAPKEVLPYFGSIDRDRDGNIDRLEAYRFEERMRRPRPPRKASVQEAPQRASVPDPNAAQAGRPQSMTDLIAGLDRDADGRLSPEEAPEKMRESFDRFDANNDGFFGADEAASLDRRMRLEQGDVPGRRSLSKTVQLMDTNSDGRLQHKEAPRNVQRVFEQVDLNGDGSIDSGEASRVDAMTQGLAAP